MAKVDSRKHDELLSLNHPPRRVKNEGNAFGSGWHRSGSHRVARDVDCWRKRTSWTLSMALVTMTRPPWEERHLNKWKHRFYTERALQLCPLSWGRVSHLALEWSSRGRGKWFSYSLKYSLPWASRPEPEHGFSVACVTRIRRLNQLDMYPIVPDI